jgi:thiol-disulfide isomerase/thioredoxin
MGLFRLSRRAVLSGLVASAVLGAFGCSSRAPKTAGNIGEVAPEISGEDLDGQELKLSDFRGSVVVLDFWGDWCGPCRSTYPHLCKLAKRLESEPFAIVGVNSDTQLERLKHVIEKQNIRWRSFSDGPKGIKGPIARAWGVEEWPTILVLDGRGVVRYRAVGGNMSAVVAVVDKLLAGANPQLGAKK